MYNKHDFIALAIFAIAMAALSLYLMFNPAQTKQPEITVPVGYHMFYDDNKSIIIAPNEYHFSYDANGNMVLTK